MKFKKILLPLTVLISLFAVITPVNADFNDGWIAYTNKDFKSAAKEWRLLAEKGDGKSQTNLGILYFNGKGVLKDFKKSISWLKSAASQGEAEAQFILGTLYIQGNGVNKSFKTAKYWVKLAYENNFEGAEGLWNDHQLWKY